MRPTDRIQEPAAGGPSYRRTMTAQTVTVARRWPYAGSDQLPLLLSSLAITVGSFLPWVVVGDLQMAGYHGGGLWTFYCASLGIAGALVRRRQLAATSAAVAGAAAVGIGAWQVVRLVRRLGLTGWHPGVGLAIVIVGGVIALRSAWRLGIEAPAQSAPSTSTS